MAQSRTVRFDPSTGLAPPEVAPLQRRASDMKGMFSDEEALNSLVAAGNPLLYEFYDMGVPENEGDLAYGTSIVYPGRVGNEFYMTKGHFHTILDTAEVYYCLAGYGMMMMESPEGDVQYKELRPGDALYVPGRYAHRSINLSSDEKLVTYFVFRADAGHDYGTIERKGFRKLVLSGNGGYVIEDNPLWNE